VLQAEREQEEQEEADRKKKEEEEEREDAIVHDPLLVGWALHSSALFCTI